MCVLYAPKYGNCLPQNFRLVQIESICRQQHKCHSKTEILSGMVRKHGEKWRNCWLPPFSPFPTVLSKGFLVSVVKSQNCVVKS